LHVKQSLPDFLASTHVSHGTETTCWPLHDHDTSLPGAASLSSFQKLAQCTSAHVPCCLPHWVQVATLAMMAPVLGRADWEFLWDPQHSVAQQVSLFWQHLAQFLEGSLSNEAINLVVQALLVDAPQVAWTILRQLETCHTQLQPLSRRLPLVMQALLPCVLPFLATLVQQLRQHLQSPTVALQPSYHNLQVHVVLPRFHAPLALVKMPQKWTEMAFILSNANAVTSHLVTLTQLHENTDVWAREHVASQVCVLSFLLL